VTETLAFKPYPCGSIAHPYMDCALRLRERHRPRPEEIVEVRCRTAEGPIPRLWEPLAAKHRPQNGYAAKFSLPYMLASILVNGRATLADFTDEAVRDETLTPCGREGILRRRPSIDYPRHFIGHVAVRLTDGRVLEERQDHPRGGPDSPMTREELTAKFRANAAEAVSDAQASRVAALVDALAAQPRLAPLMDALTA
jgi:2-methylcitrate dehydratase PrpD